MIQENLFLTGAAESTLLAEVGKGDIYSPIGQSVCHIGIEWDFRKAMDFEDNPDIEVETIAHNLYCDVILTTIPTKRLEIGVDVRMLSDETEDIFRIPFENLCDTGVSFLRSDLALAEIPVNRLPISRTEPVEQDIPHVFDTDRSIKIT